MKVCLIFPEGELFAAPLHTARDVLLGHQVFEIWPKLLDAHENTSELVEADLVLAEVTGRNPHVLYFLGWAHALQKRTILLARYAEDFPFSSENLTPLIYARDLVYLREELARRIAGGGVPSDTASPSTADAREKFHQLFGDLLKKHGQDHRGIIEMENEKTFVLREQDLELALVQEMSRRARELGLRIKLL